MLTSASCERNVARFRHVSLPRAVAVPPGIHAARQQKLAMGHIAACARIDACCEGREFRYAEQLLTNISWHFASVVEVGVRRRKSCSYSQAEVEGRALWVEFPEGGQGGLDYSPGR